MATFTQDDVDYLRSHGNDECAKTWLGLWDPKRAVHQDQRELMIDKYERKRYFLEPASPLKSLTNAVSLKTGSTSSAGVATEAATASGARAATKTTSNGGVTAYKGNVDSQIELIHVTNGFGHNSHSTKQQYRQQSANAERSFQLTPPSTQRTTMNGLHKAINGATGSVGGTGKSTSAISRPQQHLQQNGYSHLQETFMQKCNKNMNSDVVNNNHNELNVLHMTTSRMSDSSSATSINGFGAEADFVADFGSANIFDATTANRNKMSSPPKLNGSGGGGVALSSNGYAKIQPLKRQQQQQQQQYHLLNGHGQTNGNSSQSESIGNDTSENFADFEHAPIFNAAANYNFVRKTVIKRCAGGQQSDSETSKSAIAPTDTPTSRQSPAANLDLAAESSLDKNFYADIRQATTHSENANSFSFPPSNGQNGSQAGSQRLSKVPDVAPHSSIQTPGTEEGNKLATERTVNELRSQLKTPQIYTFSPSVTQAEYNTSNSYPQVRCTELTIMSNQTQSNDPNQDQGGFCGGNVPQIDWSQYANNTPTWPPESSCMLGARPGGNTPVEPTADAAASQTQYATLMNQEQQQAPPTCCPQVKFCAPQVCPLPCFPPPCSPRVCPLPPCCPADAAQNANGEQETNATIAGLSYGPIPQQTLINTAQNRSQNGGETQTEACLQPTPSYSTLYNRSYCQPPVFAYQNPFIQQTLAQPAQMPSPPECYNPFHPYCISGSCPRGCMPSNSIPVGDPIIDPSCNMHSPYNNCFCNNWCLPIPSNQSGAMNIHRNNSQSNNNNNGLSSTPSEDRYAALKDLDEQLRESKAAATVASAYGVETFGNNGINGVVNPFKHQQANPFQATAHGTSPTATQNYFGQMTVISNGNGILPQQPTANTHFYNYSNDYGNAATTAGTATAMFPHTVIANGPSGCGFSLGALQPTAIAATGAGGNGAFNNPFAATGAINSNNPFL